MEENNNSTTSLFIALLMKTQPSCVWVFCKFAVNCCYISPKTSKVHTHTRIYNKTLLESLRTQSMSEAAALLGGSYVFAIVRLICCETPHPLPTLSYAEALKLKVSSIAYSKRIICSKRRDKK